MLVLMASASPARGEESMHHHHPTRPLIVDTDMALDDVRALFALLADADLDLRVVSTVEGSASVGRGTDNLLGLLEACGVHDVAVLRGEPLETGQPPRWRERVDGLRGANFAPPRGRIVAYPVADRLPALLASGERPVILALGPLTNLARLERDHPGALDGVHEIWMPVDFDGDRLAAWNMEFDVDAARVLLDSGRPIVLLDVIPDAPVDPAPVLRDLEGSSPAAQWIGRTLEGQAVAAPHWLIYDELAAAAMALPDVVRERPRRYALDSGDELRIVEQDDGPLRVAQVVDTGAAVAWLRERWQAPLANSGEHASTATVDAEALLTSFHGHLGPYLVLGYRMGQLALAELASDGHFDLSVHVHSPLEPPASCLIDGVQLGSGCTLGKRNIEVSEATGAAWAVFTAGDGREITILLRPELPDRIRAMVEEMGVEAAARALLNEGDWALFVD